MERRELEDFILWLMEESGHQICTKPDERNNHSVIPLRNPRSDPRHYPEHIAARYLQLQKKEPVTQERFRDIVEAALHIAEERTTILAGTGEAPASGRTRPRLPLHRVWRRGVSGRTTRRDCGQLLLQGMLGAV